MPPLAAAEIRRVAAAIDHTLLKPEARAADFERLADEAVEHGFAAVCVPGSWVEPARRRVEGSGVRVAAVVGFPHGNARPESKAAEARAAADAGADELDTVLQIGRLLDSDDAFVEADLRGVVGAGAAGGAITKVIIETALLPDEETKRRACRLAVAAGAAFVKTSTGFAGGGATVADVRLMREAVGPDLGVKAAGGIGTLADAAAMLEAGATRLGCSRSVAIVTGGAAGPGY